MPNKPGRCGSSAQSSSAGGLSAGVVLLWWPMFFATDSVHDCGSGRGIVWTLAFELLLVAFSPFELALWNTHRGERHLPARACQGGRCSTTTSPTGARHLAAARGASPSGRFTVPLALIAVGVGSHIPRDARRLPPPRVTQVHARPCALVQGRCGWSRVVEDQDRDPNRCRPRPSTRPPAGPSTAPPGCASRPRARKTTAKEARASTTSPVVPKAHVKEPRSTSGQSEAEHPRQGDTTSGAPDPGRAAHHGQLRAAAAQPTYLAVQATARGP